ncbi:hypothetical protein AGMMS50256_31850 [Betaproteobacteria bacterium]|nr:hypothetical protein AGMMS50256_31850 [Betaproteobacteria bacterium]
MTHPAPRPNGKRGKSLALLVCVFLLLALAWGAYWFYLGRWQESTDDAYVTGHIVQITPQVGGTVRAVRVNDTDEVVAGEVLVELDDADSKRRLGKPRSGASRQSFISTRSVAKSNANAILRRIRAVIYDCRDALRLPNLRDRGIRDQRVRFKLMCRRERARRFLWGSPI